jgi:hypothetical protein
MTLSKCDVRKKANFIRHNSGFFGSCATITLNTYPRFESEASLSSKWSGHKELVSVIDFVHCIFSPQNCDNHQITTVVTVLCPKTPATSTRPMFVLIIADDVRKAINGLIKNVSFHTNVCNSNKNSKFAPNMQFL